MRSVFFFSLYFLVYIDLFQYGIECCQRTVDGKNIDCFCLSSIRTSHTHIQQMTCTNLWPQLNFIGSIFITNILDRDPSSYIYTFICAFLCTTYTVAYLFLDRNVKSDAYLLKQSIRTAIALGYIIDFDSSFFSCRLVGCYSLSLFLFSLFLPYLGNKIFYYSAYK